MDQKLMQQLVKLQLSNDIHTNPDQIREHVHLYNRTGRKQLLLCVAFFRRARREERERESGRKGLWALHTQPHWPRLRSGQY